MPVQGKRSAIQGLRMRILESLSQPECLALFRTVRIVQYICMSLTVTSREKIIFIWFTTFVCASLVCTVTKQWVPVPGESWIGLLWIGIMINGMAYLCWALAIRGNGSTAAIANLAYLTPFLSLIVSAVFLHEKIEIQAAAALFLIIGGILIQNMPGRRPKMQIPAGQR